MKKTKLLFCPVNQDSNAIEQSPKKRVKAKRVVDYFVTRNN